jgi:hypothetical protein
MATTSDDRPVDAAMIKWAPISRFCLISGLGRTQVYQLLAARRLRGKKAGKRTLIDVPHGLAAVEAMPDAEITLPNSRRPIAKLAE